MDRATESEASSPLFRAFVNVVCGLISLILLMLLLLNMFEHASPLGDLSIVEILFLAALYKLGKNCREACRQQGLSWVSRLARRLACAALPAIPALLLIFFGWDFPLLDLVPLGSVLLAIHLATPATFRLRPVIKRPSFSRKRADGETA